MTRSIDNPAARMEATSWSNWAQSYEVGPPNWIHAQSAPILTDVIPMLLMLANHAACVAGVCVTSAGMLIPNTGPLDALGVDVSVVDVLVVVVEVAVVEVAVVESVVVDAGACDVERPEVVAVGAGTALVVEVVVVVVEEATDEVALLVPLSVPVPIESWWDRPTAEWCFAEAVRAFEASPLNFDEYSVTPNATSDRTNARVTSRRGTNRDDTELSDGSAVFLPV